MLISPADEHTLHTCLNSLASFVLSWANQSFCKAHFVSVTHYLPLRFFSLCHGCLLVYTSSSSIYLPISFSQLFRTPTQLTVVRLLNTRLYCHQAVFKFFVSSSSGTLSFSQSQTPVIIQNQSWLQYPRSIQKLYYIWSPTAQHAPWQLIASKPP